jgi:hypothetical protein
MLTQLVNLGNDAIRCFWISQYKKLDLVQDHSTSTGYELSVPLAKSPETSATRLDGCVWDGLPSPGAHHVSFTALPGRDHIKITDHHSV